MRSLNRTKRDGHSDAHADRSRVVTFLEQSARSCCATTYDSGEFPGGASPHAGGVTLRSVWVPVSPSSLTPVRCRADAERSSHGALLFALQCVPDRTSLPSWHAHFCR